MKFQKTDLPATSSNVKQSGSVLTNHQNVQQISLRDIKQGVHKHIYIYTDVKQFTSELKILLYLHKLTLEQFP